MAQQAGIDLAALKGSGPNGRIVKADIEAAQRCQARPPRRSRPQRRLRRSHRPPLRVAPADRADRDHRAAHAGAATATMRKVIARRLTEAKQTIPHFYVSMDIEIDALLKLREELNAKSPKEGPSAFRLSVNDLVIKAAAITLRRVPKVNASFTDDAIAALRRCRYQRRGVDPGRADHADRAPGGPEGPGGDQQRDEGPGRRARSAGKLKPEEFQGGGFSISNMGMYGVSEFAAIINPPQSAILAVAAGQQRPVVKNGALAIATVMTCTLTRRSPRGGRRAGRANGWPRSRRSSRTR